MVKKIKSSLKKNTEKTKPRKQTSPKKVIKKKETNGKNPAPKRNSSTVLADRHRMIQEAAYYRAEKRNFFGGDPVEDWVASEAEIEARLNSNTTN